MSIRDLAQAEAARTTLNADVCVVGAGIAGLLLSLRLARRGLRIVVVESGHRLPDGEAAALNRIEDELGSYRMAETGRTRGLGGTSSLWGGRMIPIAAHDMQPRPYLDLPGWPVAAADLVPYGLEIERLFGVDDLTFEDGLLDRVDGAGLFPRGDPDFATRWPKWPTFRKCNLAILLDRDIAAADGPEIWLGATVRGFGLNRATGRLASLDAVARDGRALKVDATEFVLAAGTIESTRLLLWLDAQADHRPFAGCTALGRYFQDHVSCVAGRLSPIDRDRTSRLFGFHFVGPTRRNLHLETSPAVQAADRVASAFVHVVMEPSDDSALNVIKNFLRGLQRREIDLPLGQVLRLVGETGNLARLAYWRYARNQLYLSDDVALVLSLVAEQLPHWDNRVTLGTEQDASGVPRAKLDWRITDHEERTLRSAATRAGTYWTRAGFDLVCPIAWSHAASDPAGRLCADASDIAHPSGSARMGLHKSDSVVDADLRCHAVPNLTVASAATFPTAGCSNPTYTIMQLALRSADAIASRLQS